MQPAPHFAGRWEQTMANDEEWLDEVRRWYYGGNAPAADHEPDPDQGSKEQHPIGYEAADTSLLSRDGPLPPPNASKA